MSGFKDTKVGLIPLEWEETTFEKSCNRICESYQPSLNGCLPYVGLEHIESGKVRLKDYGVESDVKSSKNKFQKGHILYGKLRPYLDKSVIPNFAGICSTDILVFESKNNAINAFLIYTIHSQQFLDYAKATTNGVQHPRTSWSSLKHFRFGLPPFPEQRKIAYVLSTIQKAIEAQQKMIESTTELKKALMQKLFTEGLNGEKQKQTEIGLVPESWEILPLEKTGEVIYGIQAAVANNFKPIGNPILTNKNITLDGEIVLDKINYFELRTKRHYNTILKKGDLLFNWRSGSKHHVGKTAFFDLDVEYVHSSFILRIRTNKKMNSKFLFYFLNYLRESGYFVKLQTYAINAKFNKSAVNLLPTILPSKNEQEQIELLLTKIDDKINVKKKILSNYANIFKSMLHQLMTGQTRVNEMEFENAEL